MVLLTYGVSSVTAWLYFRLFCVPVRIPCLKCVQRILYHAVGLCRICSGTGQRTAASFYVRSSDKFVCWLPWPLRLILKLSYHKYVLSPPAVQYFLRQQERSLLQGPALIVAVKQKMKMKEIYLSKPPMGYRCEGPAARPINRPWKKQKGLGENALSQVDANSKDHKQDRQTDAAYPVSSFRESVQRTLRTLLCLF